MNTSGCMKGGCLRLSGVKFIGRIYIGGVRSVWWFSFCFFSFGVAVMIYFLG